MQVTNKMVSDFLADKGIDSPCPSCGSTDRIALAKFSEGMDPLSKDDDNFYSDLILISPPTFVDLAHHQIEKEPFMRPAEVGLPLMLFSCTSCGHISLHSYLRFLAWVKATRPEKIVPSQFFVEPRR